MIRRTLLAACALLPFAAPLAASRAAEPGAEAMLAHRAAYRLALDSVRDNASVVQAEGVMLYEVVDACDAWATRQ
ncbi:MAG TPA: DUF1849 family protein, partial [Roseococcus sp.]|nr:DUF1849 family protein [Roseococcus sp.]